MNLSGGATALSTIQPELSPAMQSLLGGTSGNAVPAEGWPSSGHDLNVLDYLETAINAPNPWGGVYSPDPTDVLDNILTRNEMYHTAVLSKQTRPESDWSDFVDTAEAKTDNIFMDDGDIDAAVDSFEESAKPNLNRAINAYLSTMHSANALESSSILSGMAILKRGFVTDINNFRASLDKDKGAQRAQFILQSVQQMEAAQNALLDAKRVDAALNTDIQTMTFNSQREKLNEDIEYAQKRNTYELGLFPFASNVVAAAAGAATAPLGPSKLSTAMTSALNGAATGVSLGSAGGAQTALLGGLIGGALGFLGGSL